MSDAKTCSKCKKEKFLWQFSKNKSHKDGLSDACKECRQVVQKAYSVSHKSTATKLDAYRSKLR